MLIHQPVFKLACLASLLLLSACQSTNLSRPTDSKAQIQTALPTDAQVAKPGPATFSCASPLGSEVLPNTQAIEVDLWPWGKAAAVSFTIDEGVAEPFDILMPEIELRGWRASFFIYTDQPDNLKTWKKIILAHQRGHEVSNHTKTHPDLTKLSDAEVHAELEQGNQILRNQLGADVDLQSFAYPYEATDARVWSIVKQYHRYARSGDHGAVPPPFPINDARKPDFGALNAKAPTKAYSLDDWNSWVEAAVQQKGWYIDELHGIVDGDLSGGWQPRDLSEFSKHFDFIEKHPAGVWVDTMGRVANYIEEREAVKVQVKDWSDTGIRLQIEDGFDPIALKAYRVPLTFKIKVPENWQGKSIKGFQNGESIEVRALEPGVYRFSAQPEGTQPVCLLPA